MAGDLTPLTKAQRESLKPLNVSDSIRYLDAEGYERAEIARILGKRYQHVRNVLVRSTSSGARRKTLSFVAQEKAMEEFRTHCKMLGRVPDHYLNQILNQAVDQLVEREPNSPETQAKLIEIYENDFSSAATAEEVKLESPLVERIQKECNRMNLPVNFLVAAALESANAAASRALEIVDYPVEHCIDGGMDFLSDYVMSDEEVERLHQRRIEDDLLIQAVAQLKDITIAAAANSVTKLSRSRIEQMKANPEIKKIMQRLQGLEDKPVDLDDLL